ncbi:hypothetical protein OsI_38826 [Oryza sativa Indica Group]|uniref:Uncharacterized protein n=1 Tax=Oryza sativa subsp. indica TaxID=39946 RepID=A2ZLX0_ORYSI|nr:hypothetical protein OsI_38826 [Oryza sativa Indica Group]
MGSSAADSFPAGGDDAIRDVYGIGGGGEEDDPSLFLYLSDLAPVSPSAYLDLPPSPPPPTTTATTMVKEGEEAPEDLVLPFISRMLMEEDIDDKFFYDYPDNPALLQAQQPFLEILSDPSSNSRSSNSDDPRLSPTSSSDTIRRHQLLRRRRHRHRRCRRRGARAAGMEEANKFLPTENKLVIDLEASSENNYLRGLEEAKRFLPSDDKLQVGFAAAAAPVVSVKKEAVDVVVATASGGGGRGRKNPYDDEELELEGGRSSKQTAVQGDDVAARAMFDKVMMTSHENCTEMMEKLRIAMKEEAAKNEASAGGKGGNGKVKGGRRGGRDVVDLRTLLIHCAQAVATDDRRSATELLKQIKQHAKPTGDATQRLAHCFAEGLQARIAGTGSLVHQSLVAKRTSAVDILQAYQLYMAAICFKKVSFIFSNQTIYNASLGKKKIHIVDYGIQYGFQWPCFLRRISQREGGPPEVRMTGIDLPQPGFRPTERIEETGHRLSKYAQEFGVPFKYNAIAAVKMESVRKEDLNIDPDEVLIVNCQYQFKNLMDESVVIDSPRDIVLSNIRKMQPHVFIHAIVNGSFSAPFFVTRFREALFFYSALFDVLDATTPRESEQRLLIEQNIFGRAALNVIACEGIDRVERPETYKQWQVRNQRAGFKQLPLNPEIVQVVRNKVKDCYHKDFVIDIDHQWLLQGWKGRILYAISTWTPNDALSYF